MRLRSTKRVRLKESADSELEVCRLWLAKAFLISYVKTLSKGKMTFTSVRSVLPQLMEVMFVSYIGQLKYDPNDTCEKLLVTEAVPPSRVAVFERLRHAFLLQSLRHLLRPVML